jgi:hypothetical protein
VWTAAQGEPFFVCLIRNQFAMVNMSIKMYRSPRGRMNNSISISTRRLR